MDPDRSGIGFWSFLRSRGRRWMLWVAAVLLGLGLLLAFGAARFVAPVLFGGKTQGSANPVLSATDGHPDPPRLDARCPLPVG